MGNVVANSRGVSSSALGRTCNLWYVISCHFFSIVVISGIEFLTGMLNHLVELSVLVAGCKSLIFHG